MTARRLTTMISVLSAVILAVLTANPLQADLVTNGDFSTDATSFGNTNPGYAGGGTNPAEIPGWTHNGTGGRGVNGVGIFNPFGPSDKSATTYYGFLQGAGSPGSEISQVINPSANTTYDVSFLAANRGNNPNATGQVTIADNSTTYYDSGSTNWGTAAFQLVTSQFTTGGSIDGPVVLTLSNTSPAGDNTVNYSNVSVTAAIPEPTSLALFGLGSVMMLVRRRRG